MGCVACAAGAQHPASTSTLPSLRRSPSSSARPWPVPRAAALDAARLDEELTSLLGEQAARAVAAVAPARARALAGELRAALAALVLTRTLGRGASTPGMHLLGLRCVHDASVGLPGGRSGADGAAPSPHRVAALGVATIGLRYAWETAAARGGLRRLQEAAPRAASVLDAADAVAAGARLANALAFLAGGRHRTLVERVLGLSLVHANPAAPRALSFDYLNRQLVWHELAQLVLALLPLINARSLSATLRRVLPAPAPGAGSRGAPGDAGPCGACGAASPSVPFAALPCRHPHCYYCLAAACAADAGHVCWCGRRVAAMVRVRRGGKGGE